MAKETATLYPHSRAAKAATRIAIANTDPQNRPWKGVRVVVEEEEVGGGEEDFI